MKKLLVLAAAMAVGTAANAAVLSLATTISGSGTGAGTGSFDTVANKYDIGGFFQYSGTVSSALVVGPNDYSYTLSTSTIPGVSGFTFFGAPALGATAGAGFPTGYFLKFYNGSSVVVGSGEIKVGTLSLVPEPQTYALAAGAALLGFAAFRRARR